MIDDAMIKRLAVQCDVFAKTPFAKIALYNFARTCYAAGQDAQRESDAMICEDISKECGCWEPVNNTTTKAIRANK